MSLICIYANNTLISMAIASYNTHPKWVYIGMAQSSLASITHRVHVSNIR